MGLQVETARIDPGITVVLVSGNMTYEESDAVPSMVLALLKRGVKRLILDLNDVKRIDGIGGVSLVRCFFAAREAKADVCVACASCCVTQLFKSTPVDALIPFLPTMVAAREHFTVRKQKGQTA
jgi:anti-anti-sigma factor